MCVAATTQVCQMLELDGPRVDKCTTFAAHFRSSLEGRARSGGEVFAGSVAHQAERPSPSPLGDAASGSVLTTRSVSVSMLDTMLIIHSSARYVMMISAPGITGPRLSRSYTRGLEIGFQPQEA